MMHILRRIPVPLQMLAGMLFAFGLVFSPFLFAGHIFLAGDSFGFTYLVLQAIQPFSMQSLLADPLVGRGFPWLVTYGALEPVTHFFRLITDQYGTLAWVNYLTYAFGAFLFALFLKTGGRTALASFAGGVVLLCAPTIPFGDFTASFGLLLFSGTLLTMRFYEKRPVLITLTVIILVAYHWFVVHYNYAFLSFLGVGLFVMYEAYGKKGTLWARSLPIRIYVSGLVLGTCIGLLKLLPALAYLHYSERGGGLAFAAASTVDRLHFSHLYTWFFPYMRLPLLPYPDNGFFYGVSGLALLLLGVWAGGKKLAPLSLAWFTAFFIAVPHSPLFWIIHHLPVFHFLRGPARYFYIANAAAAAIIAVAFDQTFSEKWRRTRRCIGAIWLGIGSLFLCIAVALTIVRFFAFQTILQKLLILFDTKFYAQTSQLSLDHYHAYIERIFMQFFDAFSLASPLFLIPLILIFITGWSLRSSLSEKRPVFSRTLLAFLLVTGSLWPLFFYHARGDKQDIQEVAAMQEMEILRQGGYVLPVMPGLADFLLRTTPYGDIPEERLRYQLSLLVPNTHAMLGIASVDFYQPIQSRRMFRILALLGDEIASAPEDERLAVAKIPIAEKIEILASRLPLIQLLNVQHVVSAWELPAPFSQVAAMKSVDRLPAIRIYEVPDSRPVVYAARSITTFTPDESRATNFLKNLTSTDQSLLECLQCENLRTQNAAMKIEVQTDTPTDMRMHVESAGASVLIVSRPRMPGWRVDVDDKPVRTAIANSLFFGIPMSEGIHDVHVYISYLSLIVDSAKLLLTGTDPWLL